MIRTFATFMCLAMTSGCLGESLAAVQHFDRLVERWRWVHYWEGRTELGSRYVQGAAIPLLLFWRTDNSVPSVGFCSVALDICQFYPNPSTIHSLFETQVARGEDNQSAFRRFLASDFEQYNTPLWQGRKPPRAPSEKEYTSEATTIVLPQLDPPEAIQQRKRRPDQEIAALVR